MVRGLILAAVALIALSVAHAADRDGMSMPDMRVVNGTQMHLNGIGLRTFSVLGIRIYVAGLYLERRSDNPDAILHSPETKLLDIRFLRDVDAEDAAKHGRRASSKIARRRATLILTTSSGFLRRSHRCARAMAHTAIHAEGRPCDI